ncbi:testis-expressed protein 36 [Macrotis lagotis]|uniref:testis-expressed protein 36 n=1 Tax=Macrotis lagotis TaxID=92651 RepID=UPI003D69593C
MEKPKPTKPTKPTKSTKPFKPTNPTIPTKPTKPSKSSKPVKTSPASSASSDAASSASSDAASSATAAVPVSLAVSGSPHSSATLGSQASSATLGSAASSGTLGSRASSSTPVSAASSTTLVSPDPSPTPQPSVSPDTPGVQGAQTPLYLSFSYVKEVSKIIASRKQRAGIWFSHLGLIEKTPESTTTAMMKQPFLPESKRKVEAQLPLRYQILQKQANRYYYPFSMHNNKHSLDFCGHGLDEGLGRKKLDQVQTHFHSTNFNRWASGYIPSPDDSLSTYQASYMPQPRSKGPLFGFYPKHHADRWNAYFI